MSLLHFYFSPTAKLGTSISCICAILLSLLMGCVSVNLPAPSQRKAQATYANPPVPFVKANVESTADAVWRNPKNGNNISYFSQCDDKADPELESIRNELALGLHDYHVLSSNRFPYNGREALRSVIKGKVDGVETQMDVVVFKRNNCIYTLSLVGLAAKAQEDGKIFSQFVEGFQAK